jgi:hypothetical protein
MPYVCRTGSPQLNGHRFVNFDCRSRVMPMSAEGALDNTGCRAVGRRQIGTSRARHLSQNVHAVLGAARPLIAG